MDRRQPQFMRTKWFKLAVLTIAVLIVPVVEKINYEFTKYELSPNDKAIVSQSSIDPTFIKETDKAFSYDRSEEKPQIGPVKEISVDSPLDSTGEIQYTATLPKDPKDGMSFGDAKGERSFSLTSQDELSAGRLDEGRVVYPVSPSEKHIYSYKKNGIKEDILLSKPTSDVLTFNWKLNTGSTLEARMMPSGGVGIYSANPYLFGDISISDEDSQKLIDNAKTNGEKDHLVFIIPTPFIIDEQGNKNTEDVSFNLKDSILTLKARNMLRKQYPLSIDPSVVVTTTANFATGADDGMINYATADQIGRSTISSGTVGTTTQQTNMFTNARHGHTSVVYNSYIYVIGGCTAGTCTAYENDIIRCPINAGADIGTCVRQTNAFTAARYGHSSVVYNGYLYIIGGYSGAYENDIQRCSINGDGSVNACVQQTSAFDTARSGHTSVVYNGYLYIIGGYSGSYHNDIQRCSINADGSVNACVQQTSAFTTARRNHTSVSYNNYLYVVGGCNGGGTCLGDLTDIIRCPINVDGSVGTCITQTGIIGAVQSHSSVAYNGYLYLVGGSSTSILSNSIQNCPINSDGSIGTCVTKATAFTTARRNHTTVVNNGYMYILGGCTVGYCTGYANDIQYISIAEGLSSNWTATTTLANTSRAEHSATVAFGRVYVLGGIHATSDTLCHSVAGTPCSDVQYATLNTDGTLGTWTTTTSLPVTRYGSAAAVVGRYIYLSGAVGGATTVYYAYICDSTTTGGCTAGDANIGKIGTWATTTVMGTSRGRHAMTAYNGRLYAVGGQNAGFLATTEYATLNANGTIASWTPTTSFATARRNLGLAAHNGYMYLSGGVDGSSSKTDVQYAQINSDGSLGTWNATTSIAVARHAHGMVANEGYLYITGGYDTGDFNTGYMAYICDGTTKGGCTSGAGNIGKVGTWSSIPTFTNARRSHASVASNGYIYVIGGCAGNCAAGADFYNTSQYSKVGSSGGDVGTTTQQTNAFTTARYRHASVAYNGYLYIIGGWDGATAQGDIQYCPINASGSVGTCTQQTNAFTTARHRHTTVIYKGYLYIIGGEGGAFQSDIQYCPINANGSVGTCIVNATGFTTARGSHTSVVYNNFLYIIGGCSAGSCTAFLNDIQYCPINAGGSVGACTSQAAAFSGPRESHASVAYNGYLYIIGGCTAGTCTTYNNDILYCPINSGGDIGTCITQAGAFTGGRDTHESVAYNGYLYIIGGDTTSFQNDIQSCPFNANGSVGACTQQTNAFTTPRYDHTTVVYNGFLYIAGGYGPSAPNNDIQYLRANSPARQARYERVINIGSAADTLDSIQFNGTVKCMTHLQYSTAGSDGVFSAPTTVNIDAVAGTTYNLSSALKRYFRFVFTLDDQECGGTSTITDFTLNYTQLEEATPTLQTPTSGQSNITVLPTFNFRTSDAASDYLRYHIKVYSAQTECNSDSGTFLIRSIDQTSSQTGWQGQDQETSTAYSSGPAIGDSKPAVHVYQTPQLAHNTTYWWKGRAIDPGALNTWTAWTTCQSFTTGIVETSIQGGVDIRGGTTIQ